MNRPATIAYVLPALLALLALPACGTGASSTELVQLTDLDPRQLDVGDRVRITAQDLPVAGDIRRIAVTLRGSLARPGRAPCNAPAELTVTDPPEGATTVDLATGQLRDLSYAESTHRTVQLDGTTGIEFLLTSAMLERLMHCPGSRANGFDVPHATLTLGGASLRGSAQGVSVRIDGLTGSQAVTGSLRGPVLDLFAPPTARLGLESGANLAATQALDALGVTPAEGHPTQGGLHIAQVRPGSAAERAGLAANDVILRIDGLNVLSLGDARPSPSARRATITVLRGDMQDERVISLDGLSPSAPADLGASAILVAVAFALLAVFLLPRPALWVWFSRQLARARRAPNGKRVPPEPFARVLGRAGARALHPARTLAAVTPVEFVLPWLFALMAVSTAVAAPLAELFAHVDPDVSVVFALVVLLQRSGGVLLGWGTGRDRTFSESLRAAIRAGWVVVPAIVALGSAVLIAGGLSAQAVMASQGGAPWQWLAFRMPATVPLAALFALAQCGSLGDGAPGAVIVRPGLWRAGVA
ncbi:MAG: PDZ domain-containing protein, partial [Deltaproteobacteria bacterium]